MPRLKTDVSKRLWTIMQDGLQKGSKKPSAARVVTVSPCHMSPEGKKFYCWVEWSVEAEERGRCIHLFIYLFYFMMITFLAPYLGGESQTIVDSEAAFRLSDAVLIDAAHGDA